MFYLVNFVKFKTLTKFHDNLKPVLIAIGMKQKPKRIEKANLPSPIPAMLDGIQKRGKS